MTDGNRAGEAALVAIETAAGASVAALGPRRNLDRGNVVAAVRDVVAGERGTGQKRLDAPGPPAITRGTRTLIVFGRRQRIVAPLAGDGVRADDDAAVHHEPAAGAGADDHAEHHRRSRGGAVGGFGQRETVRVVRQPHRAPERAREIAFKRTADQPGRVGVLDQSGGRRDRAGDADADPPSRLRRFGEAGWRHGLLDSVARGRRSREWCRRNCRAARRCAGDRARGRRRRARGLRFSCRRDRCRSA